MSLQSLRKKTQEAARREYLEPIERIRDLEQDMIRVIDICMDMEERLFRQERYLSKLVRLLRSDASSASGDT